MTTRRVTKTCVAAWVVVMVIYALILPFTLIVDDPSNDCDSTIWHPLLGYALLTPLFVIATLANVVMYVQIALVAFRQTQRVDLQLGKKGEPESEGTEREPGSDREPGSEREPGRARGPATPQEPITAETKMANKQHRVTRMIGECERVCVCVCACVCVRVCVCVRDTPRDQDLFIYSTPTLCSQDSFSVSWTRQCLPASQGEDSVHEPPSES